MQILHCSLRCFTVLIIVKLQEKNLSLKGLGQAILGNFDHFQLLHGRNLANERLSLRQLNI